MNNDVLIILAIASSMSSLVTEAIKKTFGNQINVSNEILTAIVSVITSLLVCMCYIVLMDVTFTLKVGVYIVIIIVLAFISASVGYDKVTEVIGQIFHK